MRMVAEQLGAQLGVDNQDMDLRLRQERTQVLGASDLGMYYECGMNPDPCPTPSRALCGLGGPCA